MVKKQETRFFSYSNGLFLGFVARLTSILEVTVIFTLVTHSLEEFASIMGQFLPSVPANCCDFCSAVIEHLTQLS